MRSIKSLRLSRAFVSSSTVFFGSFFFDIDTVSASLWDVMNRIAGLNHEINRPQTAWGKNF
jgi:hypothetical protein